MNPSFVTSLDGTRIAYDLSGSGPALILLHGGWHTRQNWHEVGYVQRLQHAFTVIAIDIRGNGASDQPTDPAAYTIDKHVQDILAVADACGVDRFTVWGFSYGGNIGRYLAARSARIAKLVMIGIPFGPGAAGAFRESICSYRDRWAPILPALQAGTLDLATLTKELQDEWHQLKVPLSLAWLSAMLDWGAVEPIDMRCPTLWLVGSENAVTMASIQAYAAALPESLVQVHVVAGLDHMQEFTEMDRVLPAMLAFTTSA
jgi:pimeloyl-ACP methyl ester carboxylesterase